MKAATEFQVTRSSCWSEEVGVIKGAVFRKFTRIDERTTNDPAKIPAHRGNPDVSWWYGQGENHRVENGHIKRDFPEGSGGWFIQLATLEDILAFVKKHGKCIVDFEGGGWPSIEIYDNYDNYRE